MALSAKAQEHNRQQLVRKARTCIYFNGTMHDECEKGINYRQHTGGVTYGMALKLPCIPPSRERQAIVPCEFFEPLGRERAEAQHEEMEEHFRQTTLARVQIVADAQGKRTSGTIPCPACKKGTLHYNIAQVNGHIHARCDTKDCLKWME